MIRQSPVSNDLLSLGGAVTMVFSAAMGALILFVIPGACSFVGGLQVLILGFVFVMGALAFLLGRVLLWRRNK